MINRCSLTCYDLFMQFPHAGRPALDGVSLVMPAGSVNVVVGASGSGKSTLLMCLAGLEAPTRGRVVHSDVDVYGLDDRRRAAWRLRTIGLVFQNSELVPELTLRDNIALPLELLGTGRRDALKRADHLAEILDLSESNKRRPSEVSGGQAQRAAVGRALAHRPAVVLADEPTGALDTTNRHAVIDLLDDLVRAEGSTLVMVTHDEHTLPGNARIIRLADGRIVGDAS
ncbi:ABC transporter ATP-binding protein [Cutibacterium acnes]|jgi:putative ABC transport system ATP-binding protein|nr:ABC transporter ATP-binding protein [Cutibacterium acnes HL201PA1]KPG63785.1 ABC transporter ATP-binding protein [Cutibacterium acnes]KPG67626.1 ABC transporter ATP-binding protein [Cutibacterium acnes]PZA02489.1 ABC transporter ATP-binding protein [Cutibacterium acnes]WGH37101.1 ABC transporter ATP-binding protein [Cutibacterium acnes]